MPWRYVDEQPLFRLAMEALEKFGKRVDPDDPRDLQYELTIPYDDVTLVYMLGDFDRPRELDIWLQLSGDQIHVMAKNENGTDTQDMYQEADDPVCAGYQGYVLEALKRYSVLDELANL